MWLRSQNNTVPLDNWGIIIPLTTKSEPSYSSNFTTKNLLTWSFQITLRISLAKNTAFCVKFFLFIFYYFNIGHAALESRWYLVQKNFFKNLEGDWGKAIKIEITFFIAFLGLLQQFTGMVWKYYELGSRPPQ